MNPWTSALMYSSSHIDIDVIRQRLSNGFFFFAIVHPFFRSAGMYGINPLLKAIT